MGLQFVSDDACALVTQSGETTIRIAKVQDFVPAPYTRYIAFGMVGLKFCEFFTARNNGLDLRSLFSLRCYVLTHKIYTSPAGSASANKREQRG